MRRFTSAHTDLAANLAAALARIASLRQSVAVWQRSDGEWRYLTWLLSDTAEA